MSSGSNSMPRRRGSVLVEPLDDGCALYDVDGGQIHLLNATAAFIWTSCDGRRSVRVLARELGRLVGPGGPPASQLERDLRDFVEQLQRANLLWMDE